MKVGRVVAYEEPVENGKTSRSFVGARMEIDLKKPLVEGLWVPRPKETKLWVGIKYERLQQCCYSCGVFVLDYKIVQ